MNLLGKITKTQFLLIFMTVTCLVSIVLLYAGSNRAAEGADYTITTSHQAPESVTPPAPLPVDLNTATAEELLTLSGIGAVMAQRIIDYRTEHGPFTCVEDLLNISGIGEATLEKFRAHVTVSQPSAPERQPENSTNAEDTGISASEDVTEEPLTEPQNSGETTLPEQEEPAAEQEEPTTEQENSDTTAPPPTGPEQSVGEQQEQNTTPETEQNTGEKPKQDTDTEPEITALIDLNTATLEELQTLNGIGPVLAQRIIDYRTEYGPFTGVDELLNVKGIGEATLNKFRDRVMVTGQDQTADHPQEEPEQNTSGGSELSGLININTATSEELQTLNGIGPVLAQRIIDYRTEHGPFASVDELLNIKGIGEATLKKFRDQATAVPPDETAP